MALSELLAEGSDGKTKLYREYFDRAKVELETAGIRDTATLNREADRIARAITDRITANESAIRTALGENKTLPSISFDIKRSIVSRIATGIANTVDAGIVRIKIIQNNRARQVLVRNMRVNLTDEARPLVEKLAKIAKPR